MIAPRTPYGPGWTCTEKFRGTHTWEHTSGRSAVSSVGDGEWHVSGDAADEAFIRKAFWMERAERTVFDSTVLLTLAAPRIQEV